MRAIVVNVLLACMVVASERPSRLVTVTQGPVRGYKDAEYDVFVFYNIPYATAPTGRNKFKAPLPPPDWEEPYEAVDQEIICPQTYIFGMNKADKKDQEDCLRASIYIPDTDAQSLPVAVYVHGGGYVMGYGDMIDPRPLVNTKRVIIVTFNYRLGGHGFLNLGTNDIPGNAGMKDQVALLRWVQKNIAKFGGNPNDITIAGNSAGSSAVDLLMISKVTRGLFHKVIPESGSNLAAFSVQQDPIKTAKIYAQLFNINDVNLDDIYALEDFFKTMPAELVNSVNPLNRKDATTLVSPSIERDIGQEMFLDDSPYNILKSGNYEKMPMLYGFTNMEGLLRVVSIGGAVEADLESMNKNFSEYLPADLHFESAEEKESMVNKIRTHYFGTKIDEEDVLDYIDYFSDVVFVYSTLRSVDLQVAAGNNQIYLYEYSFTDENTPVVPYTNVRGAIHCAQTEAVWAFNMIDDAKEISEEYKNISATLKEMWLNFITTGNPTPEDSKLPRWPPVGKKRSPHMSLGRTFDLRGSLHKDRFLFWEEIYLKHYLLPQPPPTPPPKRIEL